MSHVKTLLQLKKGMLNIDINFKRYQNESEEEYIYRVCSQKDIIGNWLEVASLLNAELGYEYTESKYRKQFQAFEKMFNANKPKFVDEDAFTQDLLEKELNIKKQANKYSDLRNLVNDKIRQISRREDLQDTIIKAVELVTEQFPLEFNDNYAISNQDVSAILNLGDWHFGIKIDSYINTYNYDVFRERITELTTKAIKKIIQNKVKDLVVVNLNDLCSGIIHNCIRLQNRENLIQQIMVVSESLSEMLNEISRFVNIKYYSTLDNHSRVIANKMDSVTDENYSVLIDWYLKERVKGNSRIEICENEFDNETCTFSIYGWNYLAVHGDKDKVTNIVQNQSLMTRQFYDVAILAHYHHASSDEVNKTYVIANGCLSGVDGYAKDLRKTSNPSQTMIIVTPDDCLEDVCILKLK